MVTLLIMPEPVKKKRMGRPKMTDAQRKAKAAAKALIPEDEQEAAKNSMLWERDFKKLPDSAQAGAELAWIRNHPAMGRKDRIGTDDPVILSREDIKDAPSKASVTQLQHWVNDPASFQKQVLSEQKKKTSSAEGRTGIGKEIPQIEEIDMFLKSIDCAVK